MKKILLASLLVSSLFANEIIIHQEPTNTDVVTITMFEPVFEGAKQVDTFEPIYKEATQVAMNEKHEETFSEYKRRINAEFNEYKRTHSPR